MIRDHKTYVQDNCRILLFFCPVSTVTKKREYSYHLNPEHLNTGFTSILDSIGVQYSNCKVTNHLTFIHKSTI